MTARATAIADATTIKNEVSAGANTATRVGSNLLEIATNAAFTEDFTTIVRDWAGPWGNQQNPGNTTPRYLTLGNLGTTTPSTSLTSQAAVAPAPGVIRQWNAAQNASISTDSLTYTILINGVATGASIVVAGGSTTGSQSGISYSFNEGDLVAIGLQQSSTQTAANIYMGAAIGVSKP